MILRGHNEDFKGDPKPATKPVKDNGFNPCWNTKFTFNIKVPDVAILELKVNSSCCCDASRCFSNEGERPQQDRKGRAPGFFRSQNKRHARGWDWTFWSHENICNLYFFVFFRLSTGFPQRLFGKRIEAGFTLPQSLKEMGLKDFCNTTSREIPVMT